MGKLMTVLVHCNKLTEIERLMMCLPNTKEYNDNEEITRAKITLAWNKKDVQTVYRLIEVHEVLKDNVCLKKTVFTDQHVSSYFERLFIS